MPVKGDGKEEVGRKVVRQQSGSEKVRFSTPAFLGSVSQTLLKASCFKK